MLFFVVSSESKRKCLSVKGLSFTRQLNIYHQLCDLRPRYSVCIEYLRSSRSFLPSLYPCPSSMSRLEAPFPMIRQASGNEIRDCFCSEQVGRVNWSSDLRLGCRCMVHYFCIVRYVRLALGNKRELLHSIPEGTDRPGILCPYSRAGSCARGPYFLTTADLQILVDYGIQHAARLAEESQENEDDRPLTVEEVEKLSRYLSFDEPDEVDDEGHEKRKASEESTVSEACIVATSKPCPACAAPTSRYHGHECHHIMPDGGCPRCKTNWCFKCMQTEHDNRRLRGDQRTCLCGGWSNWCDPIETPRQVRLFMLLTPYPHDKRCGCAVCPDCRPPLRPGGPPRKCGACNGRCIVCMGQIQPGPSWDQVSTWVPQTKEMIAAAPKQSTQSALYEACQLGDLDDAREILREKPISEGVNWDKPDNGKNSRGLTFLAYAIESGNCSLLEFLLDSGAKCDALTASESVGVFPFLLAARAARVDMLRALMKKGANPTAKDKQGRNAVYIVCESKSESESERGSVQADDHHMETL